jgi:CubicO group peptidase (beta-lactamase class C family)
MKTNYPSYTNAIFILFLVISNMGFSQTKVEQIENLLSIYEKSGKFNGSVLVSDQGKVIYKKGFGLANMEWGIPNQPNTKHRLGSITKQFTAMLILQLVADGKLDLQKPITNYLTDYPKANGDLITIHSLLTHSSGIPNYTSFPKFMEERSRDPYTPEEFVKIFADMELDFIPGEKFSYSNSGYFLLGVLIEKISGKSYEQMLQDKIFIPLNMKDSGYDNHTTILKNRATGYEKQGREYVNSSYIDMTIPYAAGSIYSTVEDLFKWDQALYTNSILPKKYMTMYFEPQIKAWEDLHYAYGWGVGYVKIGNSTDSILAMGHGGGINGFNTNITRTTTNNSLIVLLNNTGEAPLNDITSSILAIIHGKEYDMPKQSVADAVMAVIENKGIDAGIVHYTRIKDSVAYSLSEGEMNRIGYLLMRSDRIEEARKIFQLIVEEFPSSSNAYDSFGESLMALGKKELAIINYRKSVELNPNNQNGIDALKKLGDDVSDLVKEVKVSNAVLETYIGEYELQPGFTLSVTIEGNQLKVQATGQPVFDLFPKSENEFYLKVVDAQLVFNKNDTGKIDSATLFQGGQEMIGKRIQ